MKRMPTLKSIDPKTKDGAEFLRALKKHRELQDLEEEEAARAELQEKGVEQSSDNYGAENGVDGQDGVVDTQDGNR
jgi:hypothetical protein